jgi:hypothetical protein
MVAYTKKGKTVGTKRKKERARRAGAGRVIIKHKVETASEVSCFKQENNY